MSMPSPSPKWLPEVPPVNCRTDPLTTRAVIYWTVLRPLMADDLSSKLHEVHALSVATVTS
jgi:hypothetical protein